MRLKLVLLFGVLFLILYILFQASVITIPSINTNDSIVFDWKIPSLSKDYDWKISVISKDSAEALNYRVFWDRRYSQDTKMKEKYGEIPLGGTLYEISLTDDDRGYGDILEYLSAQFDMSLVDSGWKSTIDYGDWFISGMAADGVFGGVLGFIKMDGTNIRTIARSYDILTTSWDGPGSEPECPCTVQVKILISDIEDLRSNPDFSDLNILSTPPLVTQNEQPKTNTYRKVEYGEVNGVTKPSDRKGWNTYTNFNPTFSVEYPIRTSGIEEDWVKKEAIFPDETLQYNFGPPISAAGGYVWVISVYSNQNKTINQLIAEQGNQFEDRVEERTPTTVSKLPATLVTVTTKEDPTWVSKGLYVNLGDKIFVMSNGATEELSAEFEYFYNSLKLSNLIPIN